MDGITYEEQLKQAIHYAQQSGSFDKRNIIDSVKNVCVFGLGNYFEDAFESQNVKERFNVTLLCDNNQKKLDEVSKRGGYYEDLKCIDVNALADYEHVAVILMLGDPRSAELQLRALGIENIMTYNDLALDEVMNGERDGAGFKAQESEIFKAFYLLDDEISKKVFVNILCNRIAPQFSKYRYEALCTAPQYFPEDVFNLTESECLVDCGAYDGDTLETFINVTDSKFNSVYCFELDRDNFIKLDEIVQKYPEAVSKKIKCYNYGVWDKNETISYGKMSSSDSYSIFNEKEVETAEVVKLDDFLKDKEITLIKMDIEGAEMAALKGCEKIIQSQRPKMAICVYHRVQDLWQVPIYLKALNPNYRISVRHHANFWVSETVCYAY